MRSSNSEYLVESAVKVSMESVCVFPPAQRNGQKQHLPHMTTFRGDNFKSLNQEGVTFVDAPQTRVGAHVLKVAHVLSLYDEPIIGSEGGGQQGEAQQTADPRCDHQSSKCHLHDAQLEAQLMRNAHSPEPRSCPRQN